MDMWTPRRDSRKGPPDTAWLLRGPSPRGAREGSAGAEQDRPAVDRRAVGVACCVGWLLVVVVAILAGGPEAAAAAATALGWGETYSDTCLCLFDVDRTLTAKQGLQADCGLPWGEEDAYDTAFGGGPLLLSRLGQGMDQTACAPCERGIVSQGVAGGPAERAILASKLGLPGANFSPSEDPSSPLVTGCPNGRKQECAGAVLAWLRRERGAAIAPERVYMFDDLAENVAGFEGSGMNARQVSCSSRDGSGTLGLCGGTVDEVLLTSGVALCHE